MYCSFDVAQSSHLKLDLRGRLPEAWEAVKYALTLQMWLTGSFDGKRKAKLRTLPQTLFSQTGGGGGSTRLLQPQCHTTTKRLLELISRRWDPVSSQNAWMKIHSAVFFAVPCFIFTVHSTFCRCMYLLLAASDIAKLGPVPSLLLCCRDRTSAYA